MNDTPDDATAKPTKPPPVGVQPSGCSGTAGGSLWAKLRAGRTNPWLVFLLPLVVYMLIGGFEPTQEAKAAAAGVLRIPYADYPLIYALKIGLTAAAIAYVLPGYRQFPWRVSWLAVAIGAIGVVVYIALVTLQRWIVVDMFHWHVEWGQRSGYNPLVEKMLASRPLAYGFLALRLFGLILIAPLIEEFFYRGFVMRFVVAADWWKVKIGQVNRLAIVAGTVIPVLMHPPAEWLAAAVWFSAITWLLLRTRNIWDCVAAHAVTNLLLGLYVFASGDWGLL